MTDLLDIAPQRAAVDVLGHSLEVAGVTIGDLAELLRRFPGLRQLFGGGTPGGAPNGANGALDGIAAAVPGLVAAVIAAGLGHQGDEAREAAAARLPADAQSRLFGAIVKLTMPAGIGPFVEGLATAFGSPIPATALANGSLAPSSS
jgi:hypothetical protein